ncbi:MAG: GAF domain-containing sensor histidine kinase [Anaerolineales bacterium]|nr:GAF domain-containing sensor histidine kinase [Anaerolineales bacterium]
MTLLTKEQLEERLVALHRASLGLVRELSLDAVLERIVTLAREEVDASYAALGVFDDGGELVNFIPVGMSKEEARAIGQFPMGKGLLGALRDERKALRIANIMQDERSVGFPSPHPFMTSFLGVPILLGEQSLGQIYLTNKRDGLEFTEEDQRVIETLAAYAAVAINNARMYEALLARDEALGQRNEDLALLNDIATALTNTLEVDEILEKTLDRVLAYLGIQAGEIYLREDGGKELQLAMHRGEFSEAFFTRERFQMGEGLIGSVAMSGRPCCMENLNKDVRHLRANVAAAGFRLMACIPLSARGEVVGVMCVVSYARCAFSERQMNLLNSIAAWAAITIENANLQRQARRLAVLEERERIGMDLHDGIIQSIYAVGLALDYARMAIDEDPKQSRVKIEQAIDGLNKTIRDIRAYILDLRPREFVGSDLRDSLQRLIDEFRINTLADATLVCPEDGIVGLPISHATALFHICQEALANVAKHSQARRVDVRIWTSRDRVLLEVADNGMGFDLRKMSVTLGHGLSNMHVRARKVGGDVEITSAPGEGTTVLAWLPRRA